MGMKEKKREYARIEGKQNIRENKDEEEKEEEYVKELIHTMNKYDKERVDDILMKRKKRKKNNREENEREEKENEIKENI